MAAYDDQYAAEPLSFSGVPFFESAVEAPGKRTLLQMGLQMEISVSLTRVVAFRCVFQIFHKISFGCFGDPRVSLIQ